VHLSRACICHFLECLYSNGLLFSLHEPVIVVTSAICKYPRIMLYCFKISGVMYDTFTYFPLLVLRIGVVFSCSRYLCICSVLSSVFIVYRGGVGEGETREGLGGSVCTAILCEFCVMPRIWDCVYRYSYHSYANYLYRFSKY
jgi:hypothetical protein